MAEESETEQTMEDKIKKLSEIAEEIININIVKNGIKIPNLEQLGTKYSLLVDNEEELNLINYTILLYILSKSILINNLILKAELDSIHKQNNDDTNSEINQDIKEE